MRSPSADQLLKMDPAAVVLWIFFPDGPPLEDIEERPEDEGRVLARMTALETLGDAAAVQALPHLFPEEPRVQSW